MENLEVSQLSPNHLTKVLLKDLKVFDNSAYLLKPFDGITIDFFDSFSKNILSNRTINHLPEIAALGFWLRKANLNQLKDENNHLFLGSSYRTSPLGKVFHICPANVDTMFIYSLTVSVLMGNKNILRVSSRMEAPHVKMLFDVLNSTIQQEKFTIFKSYINIISYPHNDSISSSISESVNVRVIWGGDQTIKTFKKFRTSPRTKDIVFADRVSMLCIDCNSYLDLDEKEIKVVIRNFYNDAYTFDQMGCSSPQTIYFIGDENQYKKCVIKFQEDVSDYLKINYETDLASISSLKLNRMVDDAIEDVIVSQSGNNYIKFLELNTNVDESTLHGCGGGYFYVRNIISTTSLINLHTPKVQTVSYFGLKESDLEALFQLSNGEGIDRIVPLGQALNFNYIWDGYNLFDELSKKVFIK
ncbi:acyl-CoA reductase [Flavobacterium sp. LS1R10]|uniref:acyl-CoA reductase n=1 Tax=Flavobacterium sp. LS1R10 TaxID=2497482 RepID=UPI000F81D628|nr:acyl-CoA reductase [Flavobacterium sp. LS1R10]RTY74257.1 hypothetical protein EKL96_09335 [Flavobacterium sp. LS1R10]